MKGKQQKKLTKTDRLLIYLQTHPEGITPLQALASFGIYRLSSIIYNLRHKGFDIHTTEEKGTDRNGDAVSYARYILIKDDEV